MPMRYIRYTRKKGKREEDGNLECCREGEGEPPGGLPAVAHEGEALEGVLVCGLLGRLLGPGLGAGPHHDHGEHARVHQVLHPVADRVCTQRTFRTWSYQQS